MFTFMFSVLASTEISFINLFRWYENFEQKFQPIPWFGSRLNDDNDLEN